MPSDESASSDKATPPPPPADTHSDSEVCHLEDINQPCENPTCGIHTPAAHTPALSRVVSRANLDAPWTPVEVEEDRDGGIFSSGGGVNNVDSDQKLLDEEEQPADVAQDDERQDEHASPSDATAAPPTQPEQSPAPSKSLSPPPPPTDPTTKSEEEADPTPADTSEEEGVLPQTEITPGTTPSPQPQEQQQNEHDDDDEEDVINWGFDNPSELKEHIGGGLDPFALLHAQSLERSASFPPVPPATDSRDADEEGLMNMMASEVAAGEGGRGPFDSPTEVSGGFFSQEDMTASPGEKEVDFFSQEGTTNSCRDSFSHEDEKHGGEDFFPQSNGDNDFFAHADQQETSPTRPMGTLRRQDTSQQRYDEGLPLIHDEELVVDSKKEMDFFGSEPDSGDDMFAGIDQVTEDARFGQFQRKNTDQAMHPFHSGEVVMESKSTAASQVFSELTDIKEAEDKAVKKKEADEIAPEVSFEDVAAVEGDSFFSDLGQAQESPVENNGYLESEDVAAKWQAALADDEFLDDDDDGFLPSDDEGFLSDEPEVSPPIPAANVPVQQEPATNRYAPQIQQQQPPQWSGPTTQPISNPYTPQPNAYLPAPSAPVLRHTKSAYFARPAQSPYMGFSSHAQPPKPEEKPESFVNKTEGYHSPYDLPSDIVPVLRKRPSTLTQQQAAVSPLPPGRTSSFGGSMPPPSTPGFAPPQDGPKKQPPPPKQHFFEELPMSPPKLRASSAMGRYQTGPQGGLGLQGEFGGPQGGFGGPQGGLGAPPMAGGGSHNPQQPIQQGPYGPPPQTQLPFLQGSQSPQMFAQPSRYSPAPQQVSGGHAPPPTFARQSPAVPQGQGYAPPPVTQQAAPVMNAKYAPRPAGPPQPPATQYTKPPAAPQQQVYAPPPQQQAHGPPTQLQAYAPQQQQQQQQAFSSPPAQYAASPYQQDNPGSPPAAPPQQQNYGSPLSQTAAAPRRQDYGSPPAQQAAPRQQDYGSPPAQHAAPSQQDYGSPRQLDYGSPLQAQYSSPRAQQSPMSPPASFSRSSSGQPSPEGSRRLSVEQYSLHSSRPGTAAGPPPGMDIPREEEEDRANQMAPPPPPLFNSRYAPPRNTSTPPPPHNKTLVSSPPLAAGKHISPKRFVPRAISPAPESFQPPPRAQTSSPGLHYGRPKIERPSSALARSAVPGNYAPAEQQQQQRLALLDLRKDMVQLEFMAPNDISAQDTLKRWQGAPIVVWSLGGLTTMFPTRTQRFSSDMHSTVIKCSPGEVKARQLKDILPPNDDFDKFPGPVWTGNKSLNKAKKKEAISYMDTRIEGFEKTLMDIYDPSERRAAEEKCMLWKVVRIMVENDGVVEGSPEISTAVRQVLTPEIAQLVGQQGASGFIPMGGAPTMTGALAESRDPKAVDTFRQKLLSGDREAAVWHAADQGLWAHALLISGTSGKDLWKRVVEEFIKVEVRTLGEGSESLAALYATLAGNWEESVDEIVPRGARMGMPMLSNSGGQTRTAEDRLTKWRETLALILNNRSPGDQASILALGRMLANYGWTSAAHICYIFARQTLGGKGAVFGGPDENATDFSLLGADHHSKTQMARDIDAELLSEIYELAVSLSPQALTATTVFPHLQLWKIHHAITLAENGNKAAAQKYCDAITAAVKAWNKPSPYFNQSFGHVLEDLTKRLQEAPRDASSGVNGSKWIPKLTSDAVSSSMWGAFNKFVSGGEEDGQDGPGGHQIADGEGPFGKITPSVSRVQSSADLYGSYGPGSQLYTPAPPSGGSSPSAARIAPAGRYAPSPATARSSLEGQRPNAYDTNRRMSSESYRSTPTNGNSYEPINQSYEPPAPAGNPYEPSPAQYGTASAYAPKASLQAHQEVSEKTLSPAPAPAYSPYSNGYQPDQGGTGGYEPPSSSGGYAPPNDEFVPYQPEEDDDDETIAATPKPKKSMLDDDDDTSELLKKSEAVKKSAAAGEEKRKAEEKKKAAAAAAAAEADGQKKGWFGGWFGKKDPSEQATGPIKAKLGEESSFVYDPDLKRWVNKAAGATTPVPSSSTPPPKRDSAPASKPPTPGPPSRPTSSSPAPPPSSTSPSARAPPPPPPPPPTGGLQPPMGGPSRTASASPAGRPMSSAGRPMSSAGRPMSSAGRPMSSAGRPTSSAGPPGDAMDELMGPPTGRRSTPAGRKGRKGASRYVEVIPGQQ